MYVVTLFERQLQRKNAYFSVFGNSRIPREAQSDPQAQQRTSEPFQDTKMYQKVTRNWPINNPTSTPQEHQTTLKRIFSVFGKPRTPREAQRNSQGQRRTSEPFQDIRMHQKVSRNCLIWARSSWIRLIVFIRVGICFKLKFNKSCITSYTQIIKS